MIQYEETDWEFLKRVASKKKEVILIEDGKTDTKEEQKDVANSKNENTSNTAKTDSKKETETKKKKNGIYGLE